MQFLTKVDQLKAQLEAGMYRLKFISSGMCCTIRLSPFQKFPKKWFEKQQNLRQVKRLLAIYVEGILFENFHDDMKVRIVMLFSFGIIWTM